MNPEHVQLCRRIWDYSLDEPGATFPFTARLACENGWSQEFADRVVREYKRFAFLAVASGHPVAPSDQVDQAWHLHLTYTRSYWQRFCPEVLGQPLHHHPTRGGAAERARFRDWYNQTLRSYVRFFGHAPPADIWPDASARFGSDTHHQRVDTGRHWVIPKRPLQWIAGIAVALLLLMCVATGCSTASHISVPSEFEWPSWASGDPFDLDGPGFLKWFAAAFVCAVGVAAVVRFLLRSPGTAATHDTSELDPYEAAYLAGGEQGALHAVLAGLVNRGVLTFDATTRRLFRTTPALQTESAGDSEPFHPAEQAVLGAVEKSAEWGIPLEELQQGWSWSADIAHRLKSLGLVVPDDRARLGQVVPLLIALLVPALGAIRIVIGLWHDKPVGGLVYATLIATGLACAWFADRLHRTWRGDRVVKELEREHQALQQNLDTSIAADVPLAVGLFGIGVLAGGTLDEFQAALQPAAGGADGCGGGCGGCGGGCGG